MAEELGQVMRREESLFENNKHDTLLLIIDRSEDPVTPLLNQWTYEAMVGYSVFLFKILIQVHELIGINNNRVNLDGQGMVLSELHDDFYAQVVIFCSYCIKFNFLEYYFQFWRPWPKYQGFDQ